LGFLEDGYKNVRRIMIFKDLKEVKAKEKVAAGDQSVAKVG
jgi:hypothetical protein